MGYQKGNCWEAEENKEKKLPNRKKEDKKDSKLEVKARNPNTSCHLWNQKDCMVLH
jgi:hypothetical protein